MNNQQASSQKKSQSNLQAEVYACLATLECFLQEKPHYSKYTDIDYRQLNALLEDLKRNLQVLSPEMISPIQYIRHQKLETQFPCSFQLLANSRPTYGKNASLLRPHNPPISERKLDHQRSKLPSDETEPLMQMAIISSKITASIITIMDAVRIEAVASPGLVLPYLDDIVRGIKLLLKHRPIQGIKSLVTQIDQWRIRLQEVPPNHPLNPSLLNILKRDTDRWYHTYQGCLEKTILEPNNSQE